MITEKDIIEKLTVSVTEAVSDLIKTSLSDVVQHEVSKALAKALFEGEFHRGVNKEVFSGIENIFREISSFKKSLGTPPPGQSDGLLDCSASVLDDIIHSTEKATLNILDCLEEMQRLMQEAKKSAKCGNGAIDQVSTLKDIESIITKILTELSFQDLTGQKIKIVINSLKRVEELVYEVYLMSEALRKSKEKSPDKDIAELTEQARVLVTDLRSKNLVDQHEVDALFEQYGL